jgi:hypothetical protein
VVRCSIFVTAVVVGGPALAQTAIGIDPPAESSLFGQVALEGQVGAATPLGTFGLAIDADLSRWLSVRAGAGVDAFDQDGGCGCQWRLRQLSVMPHLRFPLFDAGTFISIGAGISHDAAPNVGQVFSPLYREDNELSIEHRFENGVRVRAFTGIGFYLNEPYLPAFGGSVYYGAALGYAVWPNPITAANRSPSLGDWYGWQSLALDVSSAILVSQGEQNHQAIRGAIALYAISGPIVHFAHRNYGRLAASVLLRTLLPLTLAAFAKGLASPEDPGPDPASYAVAGAVVAALIDDLALGWSPVAVSR